GRARFRAELVLFGLEMSRKRLAPGGLRFRLRRRLRRGLFGRPGALVECASLLALHDGWYDGRWSRGGRARLALLPLRYRKQLGDALVQSRELLDELSILLDESGDLNAKRRVFIPQRFELVHRRVQ